MQMLPDNVQLVCLHIKIKWFHSDKPLYWCTMALVYKPYWFTMHGFSLQPHIYDLTLWPYSGTRVFVYTDLIMTTYYVWHGHISQCHFEPLNGFRDYYHFIIISVIYFLYMVS